MLVDARALIASGDAGRQGRQGSGRSLRWRGGVQHQLTQQLGRILFDQLGLPHVKKTKTGWSTNADVLEKLRGQHPIVGRCWSTASTPS